ncbi:hypothetical protein LguiA_020989 [Lonicera macranthoides]
MFQEIEVGMMEELLPSEGSPITTVTGLPVDSKPLVSEDFPAASLCIDLLGRGQPNRGRKYVLENSWLKREFENVPANIGEHDVEIDPYVRAYILFIIGILLFPESEKVIVPILYLHFLIHITADSLNCYAWGAAVLAKLHSCLGNNNLKNSKGAMWVLERVVRVRRDFLVDMASVPAQFPSFKGWASLLHRTTSNAHHRVIWVDTFLNLQDEKQNPVKKQRNCKKKEDERGRDKGYVPASILSRNKEIARRKKTKEEGIRDMYLRRGWRDDMRRVWNRERETCVVDVRCGSSTVRV